MSSNLTDLCEQEWATVAEHVRRVADDDKEIAGVDAQLTRLGKKDTELSRKAKASRDAFSEACVQAEIDDREAPKATPEAKELWRQAGDFSGTAAAASAQLTKSREALTARRTDTQAALAGTVMALTNRLQIRAQTAFVEALKATVPHLADLLAIEAVYNEHCGGKRVKVTLGPNDAPPFSSEFVVNSFVSKLPVQFRAHELDIAELHRAALPVAQALNSKIRQNKDLIG